MKEKSGTDFDIRDFVKLKRPRLITIIALLDEVLFAVQELRIQKRKSLGVRAKTGRAFLWVSCVMIKVLQHILLEWFDDDSDKHGNDIIPDQDSISMIDSEEN